MRVANGDSAREGRRNPGKIQDLRSPRFGTGSGTCSGRSLGLLFDVILDTFGEPFGVPGLPWGVFFLPLGFIGVLLVSLASLGALRVTF